MILNNGLRRIISIFKKQRKEVLRNKKMLTIFLMFPITMFILSNLDEEMSGSLYLFMIMGAVMPPMMSIASSIAEEREKGTLRGMIFAGVKAYEYLLGMMLFIGMVSAFSLGIMGMILESKLEISVSFDVIIVSFLAVVCSMIVGAAIGVGRRIKVPTDCNSTAN